MFKKYFVRSIALSLCSALVSVAAVANPIDMTQFSNFVPQTITEMSDTTTEVTYAEFTPAMPYVVYVVVDTPVPIVVMEAVVVVDTSSTTFLSADANNARNFSVKQNQNFERMS